MRRLLAGLAGLSVLVAAPVWAHPGHGPELAGLAHDGAQALAMVWPLILVLGLLALAKLVPGRLRRD